MGLARKILDRALALGPADDPRRVRVESRRKGVDIPLISRSEAAVRVVRTGKSGELGRFVLWAHRRGVAMELLAGEADEVWVDGELCSVGEARRRLS